MHTEPFDLDSGALCLDFANTVEWHASDHPHDKLKSYTDMLAWGEAGDSLPTARADRLRRLAQIHPQAAEAAFKRAVQLREAIYRLFADHAQQGRIDAADLALLNEASSDSLSHLQLVPVSGGFAWDWAENEVDFDQVLWPVARSAGELLTSDKLSRVRQCADDRGCGYLFVDTSRNRSRRWCSMESCGNRAKAQRHYKRQRQADR